MSGVSLLREADEFFRRAINYADRRRFREATDKYHVAMVLYGEVLHPTIAYSEMNLSEQEVQRLTSKIAHCQSSIENAELDHAARMKHMWHVRMMSVGIATSASTVVISAWKYIKHRRGNNKRKFFKWWEK